MKTLILDFLDCFIIGPWTDRGCIGKIIAALMAAFFAFIAIAVAMFCFWVADSWWIEDQNGTAEVYGRYYTPAMMTFTTISDGKTTTMIPIYIPESYYIRLRMGNETDSLSVSSGTYLSLPNNQIVPVKFRRGRISRGLYITDFQ